MKTQFFFVCLMLLGMRLTAAVLTVSNRPGDTAQYEDIQKAVNEANVGDTIYVAGSETQYTAVTINKRLTLIGTGYNVQKEKALISKINSVGIGGESLDASGSVFLGLEINHLHVVKFPIHDIKIERCRISAITAGGSNDSNFPKNWIINNNVINNIQVSGIATTPNNFSITNNIMVGYIAGLKNSVISNNVFFRVSAFSNNHFNIIENNIFYFSQLDPKGDNNSTYNNNITFGGNNVEIPYGTNNGSGNLVKVDPKFTQVPENAGFTFALDFRLKDESAGKNAGTDGTDIGVYGGRGFSESGEPPIPIIRAFVIKNGVVPPGGKLNVVIQAEAKN